MMLFRTYDNSISHIYAPFLSSITGYLNNNHQVAGSSTRRGCYVVIVNLGYKSCGQTA